MLLFFSFNVVSFYRQVCIVLFPLYFKVCPQYTLKFITGRSVFLLSMLFILLFLTLRCVDDQVLSPHQTRALYLPWLL